MDSRERLIEAVLQQIVVDVVEAKDLTGIEEMVRLLPADVLLNFLPET